MRVPAKRLVVYALAGPAVAAFSLAFLCLQGIDYQPYFQTKYWADTTVRLNERANQLIVRKGPIFAGFGRARLTPSLFPAQDNPHQGDFRALPLAGYGNRNGRPATGVHDDLFVKAVSIRVGDQMAVLVGVDALIVPPEAADIAIEELGRELGLRRDQIYFSATHTHSGLGGWGEGMVAEAFAGPYRPGVRKWMSQQIEAAVRMAVRDLAPASLGHDRFDAPQFVRNRLVGRLGRTDPEFDFLVLKQDGGHVGVIGSYAAHATVLSGGNMELSADYPGAWQRAIEEATGGTAVFLAGGVGSHGPVAGAGGFEGVNRMGHELAQEVIHRFSQVAMTNQLALAVMGLDVSLPPLSTRLTDGIRLRPWLARRILPVRDHTYLQAVRLGEEVWISTPCDFSGELALSVKDALRPRGIHVVVTSFNGDYIGYVIDSRYYHMAGYEPRLMSFFGPNVPDYLHELVQSLALDISQAAVTETKSDSSRSTASIRSQH